MLIKVFKVLNPSKYHYPTKVLLLFKDSLFYPVLIIASILNFIIFLNINYQPFTSVFSNSILFFLLIIIIIIHEMGHSISAYSFKVKVRELGFGIYYIFPVFYVDLGEAWKLNQKKRSVINLSGIYFQLIIGLVIFSISLFITNNTLLLNLFYLNFLIIITNLNPFFRFDGFWVLSDLLYENDLVKKSNQIIKSLLHLTIPKEKLVIILYSILKLCFIVWVVFKVGNRLFRSVVSLINTGIIKGSDIYLPIFLLFYIFYIIILTILKRKYELANRKRSV